MGSVSAQWSMRCVLAAGALVTVACGAAAAGDLRIGSPAPALDVGHWFWSAAGAGSITAFKPGKAYVVAFWSTRSPRRRDAIVQCSTAQNRHADDGVTVIGIGDEDVKTIETFLRERAGAATVGALTQTYRLATDPDGSVRRDYMEAAARCGVPMAFIVGRTGQIEWFGPPLEMDEPLARIVDGTWDRDACARRMAEFADVGTRLTEAVRLLEAGKGGTVVDLLDELIASVTSVDLKRQLGAMRRNVAWSLYHDNPSASLLNAFAWPVVECGMGGDSLPSELLAAALAAAERGVDLASRVVAVEVEPEKGNIMDTLAHLQALAGDLPAAVATQREAAEHAGTYAEPINEYLMELEKLAAGE